MQIEHITLGGNSTLRDSDGIEQVTIDLLKRFQLGINVSETLDFPHTSFRVKVTSVNEGAIFDIKKGDDIGVMNVCCFNSDHSSTMFKIVTDFHQRLKFGDPRLPVLDNWIYSIPVNPFALSPQDFKTAGEVELYIYYSLYLGRL